MNYSSYRAVSAVASDLLRVRLGHSAHVGSMSGLPESGYGWAIFEYMP
jgi:hypothetical protein